MDKKTWSKPDVYQLDIGDTEYTIGGHNRIDGYWNCNERPTYS